MAVILNIETSTEVCSVALGENGELLFEKESREGLNHSELLTVFIEELFTENNFNMRDIDAVAVSKGPGSYTGLRIGVSVAKGLCYALDKPLISVGSLDSMGIFTAQNIESFFEGNNDEDLLLCPMIDARRMEVFTALYKSSGQTVQTVSAQIIDENSFSEELKENKILFFGNGAQKCREHLSHPNALFNGPLKTSARFMLFLAEKKYNKKEFEDVAYFEPFYLKNFVATIPKNKILK
ncbi:tRNA (adenosine(37)-N6)-threonylcarbamoyltransferase complex dimerization subunit type 1 TsaB [Maribellus maritimus]|uniref:tRNA (adenosine(37)-N6)-threonylcarbamoyltransferase complex dimerization subunit type 1 TsaB n=1 Tax=Maribellus maritimus TaxID=2870838 RepID=UPI001EEB4A3C|nr:tRNA (adenosine(37)-N6)-threonylcarbamoyltransferase complex dimerization subunit type 1 TsaB [Maribellus maritimus]MCG6190216.1 tRNA (adenosine(37)-N6)-threonylcarbamoyltransferase complex dimerization subunit type 1 TsaB [Maribellus maritimus]